MRSTIRYIQQEPADDSAIRLHCNEGATPPLPDGDRLRRYPDLRELMEKIAQFVGRPAEQVVVTAGADGAIDRVMRAFAGPGTTVAVSDPTFEMIPVYAAQTGARVVRVPAGGEEVIAVRPDVLALVTPDNPTGRALEWATVELLATAMPDTVVLLDLAYVEYADEDFTDRAAELENIVVTRTFSKAWGLAGLRVGYALAPQPLADRLRAVGSPYPVSSESARLVAQCLAAPGYVAEHVARVRVERRELATVLGDLGVDVTESQANFVFARFDDAALVADVLRADRIEVRRFAREGLRDALRIGCPDCPQNFERLDRALRQALDPDALLFDMDGVLADVRRSYRAAIIETCARWGVGVTAAEIADEKTRPQSNDDFVVTQRMLADRGVDAPLELITRRFQASYDDGLWEREELLVPCSFLEQLAKHRRLGVVTGRPRADAERFLASQGIADFFDVVVCRDDAPMKPDPAPVQLAMRELGAETAWMFGDTADDLCAAAAAGAVPIGVVAPGEESADVLRGAGAVRVIANLEEVERWLK